MMKKISDDFPPINQVFSPRKLVRLLLRLASSFLAIGSVLVTAKKKSTDDDDDSDE